MTLENLVPPLALCRKIPKGKFEDSTLVWSRRTSRFAPHEWVIPRGYAAEVSDIAPAPTLAEVMAALPSEMRRNNRLFTLMILDAREKSTKDWQIGYASPSRYGGMDAIDEYKAHEYNPVTAALKLWLKLEGGK